MQMFVSVGMIYDEGWLSASLFYWKLLQFYSLANKPLFFDGLQYLWKGFKEVAGAFDGIMEHDYCTRLKVRDYVAGAGVAVDVAVIIAADDVPHYMVVSFIQYPCLVWTYAGVWGAEKV